MRLDILPDRFGKEKNEELDDAVNRWARTFIFANPLSLENQQALLGAIVDNSDDKLDLAYTSFKKQRILFDTYENLGELLSTAWSQKKYSDVRNLECLVPHGLAQTLPSVEPTDVIHKDLSGPFEATYIGSAADGFYEYLTYNEKLFRSRVDPQYYARFCSIIQSSGTGKSRMLMEMNKKDIIVIYLNLRDEGDRRSFPPRDLVPSRILTTFPETEDAYRNSCCAFFIALFDTVNEYVAHSDLARVRDWVRQMCDVTHPPRTSTRSDFFAKLDAKYKNGDTTAMERLPESYSKMATSLERLFPKHSNRPKLLMAFDEAHSLAEMRPQYRPANVLCRIVAQYSHSDEGKHAIWLAFASTTSKVRDFAAPNNIFDSLRVAVYGQQLFPPYTQLGWDQHALPHGDVPAEQVSRAEHIVRFGRPLWVSLKTAASSSLSQVLHTASEKLCAATCFNPRNEEQVLAVLGQRFDIKITFGHPDSVRHLEDGVASHLRICLATTLDRNWRLTSYPSEPLLSCVAANKLHDIPENLEHSLRTLLKQVNRGMIDIGQRGELASRLLWLLAKDLYVRTQATREGKSTGFPLKWDEDFIDCKMVPVVGWLEFVFGPKIWKSNQGSRARNAFKDAYINFSHWTPMDGEIAGPTRGGGLSLNECTSRHWQRTSAMQCCHHQDLVDKMIPVYFKALPAGCSSAPSRMSQIFVSDKARRSRSSEKALEDITRAHKSISNTASDPCSLPYIAILADFGWRPLPPTSTLPAEGDTDPCLRIYASGVNATTYPFLAKHNGLREVLEDLVRLQKVPEEERPYMEHLNAQVKFGATVTPEHLRWECMKDVPSM